MEKNAQRHLDGLDAAGVDVHGPQVLEVSKLHDVGPAVQRVGVQVQLDQVRKNISVPKIRNVRNSKKKLIVFNPLV